MQYSPAKDVPPVAENDAAASTIRDVHEKILAKDVLPVAESDDATSLELREDFVPFTSTVLAFARKLQEIA